MHSWHGTALVIYQAYPIIENKRTLMKQIYTALLLTLVTLSAQSRTLNTVTTYWGDWSIKGNWSLNRVPQDGDSIVVPAGYAIVLNKNTSFTNVYINVLGNLTLQKTLTLDNQST